ncbi:MAG: proline--tRNA ligase [Firmicutes bacterium]|nr:proline--tRNA ligase [Bacillota bacterium]
MEKQIKNEAITSREKDFAQWYTDVCKKAELMDYSSIKGFIIYRPYGYAIWEQIQKYLDQKFKDTGHENVYMPMVIPQSLFNKEKEHVEGFAPETLIATLGGKEKLDDPLIIRPTSEVLFCEHYAKIINSYRDLPKKYNQWCSVVRWEKTTRPFLRGAEFLWQEGHTVHETEQEARFETLQMLKIYQTLGEELLAIPFLTGRKTEKEKFAGAKETYAVEALMHDGKSLQSGTSHYFGTGFAEAFGIQFQNRQNQLQPVHQTSWGVSTRLIGGLIMVHGDDNGLILPPRVAPIQVMIVPIMPQKPGVLSQAKTLFDSLKQAGIRVMLDESDNSPGWKYAEAEMKGIPLRIELGPRDLEQQQVVMVKRNDKTKKTIKFSDLVKEANLTLEQVQQELLQHAKQHLATNIREANSLEELTAMLNQFGGYVKVSVDDTEEVEKIVKEKAQATARVIPFDQVGLRPKCAITGKPAKRIVYFARAY